MITDIKGFPSKLGQCIKEETLPDNVLSSYLVKRCIEVESSQYPLNITLAASFDLLVAAKYYRFVVPEDWLWCEDSKLDFFPIQNACPSCCLRNVFVHHVGKKPTSGQIGPATAEAFRQLLSSYFNEISSNLRVFSGSEPIDIAIIDEMDKNILIAEVKAAPLFTPPLCMPHKKDSLSTTVKLPLRHSIGIARNLHLADIFIFIPVCKGKDIQIPLPPNSVGKGNNPDESITTALKNMPEILLEYFSSWATMWEVYKTKNNENLLYWFCGACGLPKNVGEGWPSGSDGKPTGSISDSKTSVGLDRTDDIKKATFQVLKLGVENRKENIHPWNLKIGLASNLDPARHYDAYLSPYESLVWGWSKQGKDPKSLYNLFDGIISFTKCVARDQWIKKIATWEKKR